MSHNKDRQIIALLPKLLKYENKGIIRIKKHELKQVTFHVEGYKSCKV
jgi:hypothetical protein